MSDELDKTTEEIRKGIQATLVVNKKDDEGNPIKDQEKKEEIKEPEKKEEIVEAKEEEIEKSEEKQEELEEELEDKTLSAKERDKLEKRIEKERKKAQALKAENDALKAKLELDPEKAKVLTEADVKKQAREIADQEITEREFVNACNKLADDAVKIDKTFLAKLKTMHEEIEAPGIPPVMIGILEDLDNGAAVLNYLTDDSDEAERIYALSNNPVKMGVQLTKISTKLAKPKTKEISKVPEPPKALGGNGSKSAGFNPADTKNTQDWIEKRNRDIAEKRAAGRMNLR